MDLERKSYWHSMRIPEVRWLVGHFAYNYADVNEDLVDLLRGIPDSRLNRFYSAVFEGAYAGLWKLRVELRVAEMESPKGRRRARRNKKERNRPWQWRVELPGRSLPACEPL